MSDPHGGARVIDLPRHDHRPSGCSEPAHGRAPLSCDRIVEAALGFVDRECLTDLSMRRLGGELGVEAMSLYRYFPSKSVLLDAVVCRALDGLALPDVPGSAADWASQVQAYARSFRSVALAHPHLVPLMATLGPEHSTLGRVHQRMVALWSDAGLDAETAGRAQGALQGYLIGSSFWGAACGFEACVKDERGRPRGGVSDADFEFGLSALIAGLRHEVEAARASA